MASSPRRLLYSTDTIQAGASRNYRSNLLFTPGQCYLDKNQKTQITPGTQETEAGKSESEVSLGYTVTTTTNQGTG
jgi:hypothetical protein